MIDTINPNPTYMSNMKGRQAKRIRQESALKRTEAQLAEYKTGLLTSRMRLREPKKRKISQILLLLKSGSKLSQRRLREQRLQFVIPKQILDNLTPR